MLPVVKVTLIFVIAPELYDVEAESPGFKTAKRRNIPVQTEARSFVDFMLVPKEN